jgi:hypothetical protein
MATAVGALLGQEWLNMHDAERAGHRGDKKDVPLDELQARIKWYGDLWEHRPVIYDTAHLRRLGYYG